MGEVYKARGTQLEREVAINVLPFTRWLVTPIRLARFDIVGAIPVQQAVGNGCEHDSHELQRRVGSSDGRSLV